MPTPIIAYVPYAAAAYCIAKVGQHLWPSLRSQLASATRFSSIHGMDGEDPIASRRASDCPSGFGAYLLSSNAYVRNAPPYCFNVDTGKIEGTGPLNGVTPPASTVTLWRDDDLTRLATISVSGDADITIPLCGTGVGGLPQPPEGSCGRRPVAMAAQPPRRSSCGSAERNAHRSRMALRSRRWR